MQTSVIGFPRIGTLRELKFASEKYFKKEIEAGELLQKAQELRKTHWLTQKNAGITYISSNDFSFYDMVLDLSLIHISEPTRRTPISYAVFCLKKKKKKCHRISLSYT